LHVITNADGIHAVLEYALRPFKKVPIAVKSIAKQFLRDAKIMNDSTREGLKKMLCILLGWVLAITPSLADTAKVVRQYALTSANDFPQRDPQDWVLLASNDKGQTWITLDVRKGELFSERHQRRVFAVDNNAAYNMYRLQIERVRDPATADAVQLAEIELMDRSDRDFGPTPLFCDMITAQGDNPPEETPYQAFDGHAETKWLDAASLFPGSRSSWIQWQYIDHSGLTITNTRQLLALRARANENYPVRIEGVVSGPIPGAKLCILDAGGHVEVDAIGHEEEYFPGQRVLLEGTSQWNDNQDQVRLPRLQRLGTNAPARPEWIKLGQTAAPSQEFQWVETEGQVQFVTETENHLEFELLDNGRSLSVSVLHLNPARQRPPSGARISVKGLCGLALDGNGNRVAATLWVSSLDAVSVVDQTMAPANPAKGDEQPAFSTGNESLLTQIDEVRNLTPLKLASRPRVKLHGVVTESGGLWIQDGTGGIETWFDPKSKSPRAALGDYVEVEGIAVRAWGHGVAGYGPVVFVDQERVLSQGKLPDPLHPSWALLASGQTDAQWVEVDAMVRATDGCHLLLASESGQLMATINSAPVSTVSRLVDATVRLRGVSVAATDEHGQLQGVQLVVPSMQFVEIRQAPPDTFSMPPQRIDSLRQVRAPKQSVHRVKVQGVLTCVGNRNYFVEDDSGGVMAIGKEDVTLSLPAGGWWTFWQHPKTNNPSPTSLEFRVGDAVEVIGFPDAHVYAPVLTEATLRKTGRTSSVTPVESTAAELVNGGLDATLVTLDGLILGCETVGTLFVVQVQSGEKVFQAFLPLNGKNSLNVASGSRVRITGVCQMEPATHIELGKSPSAFSLLLRDSSDVSLLERPPWLTTRQALLAAGTLVVILFGAFVWIRLLHRQVELRTTELRSEIAEHEKTEELLARETRLLQREIEEHKTTEGTLAKNTELLKEEIKERKSIYLELEEKKLSLEREIEERQRIQVEVEKINKQLLTTSRMAGMADVATNVLHNVGNVLNGVNVLASSIAANVQKSKAPGVTRLAALLGQHQSDLGHFMTEDENGRHIPGHLERLGSHLLDEHSILLERVKLLTENVQHIKEIVATQQNYAKVAGVWDTVALPEIVEDALRMCSEALARHEIKILRDYHETPPATLDRNKALQILFNVLDNAKLACIARGDSERQITVSIRRVGAERLRIEVADNGVGIPPENLGRIFNQGFSTRLDGHGFGLHSSILAAQDMGGTLTARSDGLGTGAAFILEIPVMVKDDLD
jgi:signal transduction histidine kinase